MPNFKVISDYSPAGDQPTAIKELTQSILKGNRYQTLEGVTGSGKTHTMARIIENVKMPTIIMTHNKTLAAQLYSEFRQFFPNNHVEYFVSYYDYYQPEAYIPRQDLFIEKDNEIVGCFQYRKFTPNTVEAHINIISKFWGKGISEEVSKEGFKWENMRI